MVGQVLTVKFSIFTNITVNKLSINACSLAYTIILV